MSLLIRAITRLCYYPSLGYSEILFALGRWRKWDWVDEHVLVGAVPYRRDLDRLHALGIRAIVNMCEEFRGHTADLKRLGLSQLWLPTLDFHCPDRGDLVRGVVFIRQQIAAGRKVYVHCKVGRSRSVTMAMVYLMANHSLSAGEAWQRLHSVRPQITRLLDRQPGLAGIETELRRLPA